MHSNFQLLINGIGKKSLLPIAAVLLVFIYLFTFGTSNKRIVNGIENSLLSGIRISERKFQGIENAIGLPQKAGEPRRYKVGNATVLDTASVQHLPRESCTQLRLDEGQVPICVYPEDRDEIISAAILRNGSYEPFLISEVLTALKTDGELGLIDMGANLGIYTLPAAALLGRRVVALEPLYSNFRHLASSVTLAGVQDRVTIVTNVIACCYRTYNLEIRYRNFGGIDVRDTKDCTSRQCAESIYPDDVLPLVTFKKAVMKMDIESFEGVAFEKADSLFDTVDIFAVFMEWVHVKKLDTRKVLLNFMERRKYLPFSQWTDGKRLEGDYQNWPDNLVWRKL